MPRKLGQRRSKHGGPRRSDARDGAGASRSAKWHPALSSHQEAEDVVRLVNDVLSNLAEAAGAEGSEGHKLLQPLRRVAVVKGLANHHLRSTCWPLLVGHPSVGLGGSSGAKAAEEARLRSLYAELSGGGHGANGAGEKTKRKHRDEQVVRCDVARCLFNDVGKRPALTRLIDAVVCSGDRGRQQQHQQQQEEEGDQELSGENRVASSEGEEGRKDEAELAAEPPEQDVYYYQGLHDIASVLLLVLEDECRAFGVLRHLATHHLRDCTRVDLFPVLESLSLVFHLLQRADRALHDHIRRSQVPPHFALVWRLTWFSHDLLSCADSPGTSDNGARPRAEPLSPEESLEQCARLFDVFIASHPLMPLYVGVACLVACRECILETECEFATMHQRLSGVTLRSGGLPIPVLVRKALHLYKLHPPSALAAMDYTFVSEGGDEGGFDPMAGLASGDSRGGNFPNCTAVRAFLSERGVWCAPHLEYVPAKKRVDRTKLLTALRKLIKMTHGLSPPQQQQQSRSEISKPGAGAAALHRWSWIAMLGFSGVAGLMTATAALAQVLSFWDDQFELQFQLL